jgi:hypothetical protein
MQDIGTERLTADEAFALVGHETCVAILRAMLDAAIEADDPTVRLSFSDLRERVGLGDPDQFDYHLGKLLGSFIHHDTGGYQMCYTALLVVGTVLVGTDTERGSADPVAAADSCPVCGGTTEATYEGKHGTVDCAECGEAVCSAAIQPGVLDGYDPNESRLCSNGGRPT